MSTKDNGAGLAPICFGRRTLKQPLSSDEHTRADAAFAEASLGQQWQGACGITYDGAPWIVVVTGDAQRVERCKRLDFG
jgi:hypothetical protein